MDDCPRCQSPLERLSLAEAETVACTRCGYADIPVEHEAEWDEPESWRDAMNRFYEQ
ncbi:hypothetical protein [Halovivax limisalsi]|uniref:hypothetical protein n=1 Tax=Halovivax limisalsi TaxID=1453760 RepID=UPI001FFCFF2E|nr:hypothetical protein [Halovivax limisalsi]